MDNTFKELIKKGPVLITVKNASDAHQHSTKNNKTFIAYLKNGITALPNDIKVEEYYDASGTLYNFDLQSKVLTIYAVNYNILRIMSGMSSVLFSIS